MPYSIIHCCKQMDDFLADIRIPIEYFPKYREYGLPLRRSAAVQGVLYCPWCGITLPSSVRDEYFDILEKECGVTDDLDPEQQQLIPAEFTSDAWWKKRGL